MTDAQLSRIFTVLASPTKTFQAIAERPTWKVAVLVPVVLGLLGGLFAVPKYDWEEIARIKYERVDREVPQRSERVVEFLEGPGGSYLLFAAVVTPVIICALAAWIFLALFRRVGGELSFQTSLGVFAHGFLPWSVAALLSLPFVVAQNSIVIDYYGAGWTNLGFFASDSTGPELLTVLANVDLFTLWSIALLVIGYSVAAKVSKRRAAACVVGLWIAWIILDVCVAALDRIGG